MKPDYEKIKTMPSEYEAISNMTNEEAATVIAKMVINAQYGRGNGKSFMQLRINMALSKAIDALMDTTKLVDNVITNVNVNDWFPLGYKEIYPLSIDEVLAKVKTPFDIEMAMRDPRITPNMIRSCFDLPPVEQVPTPIKNQYVTPLDKLLAIAGKIYPRNGSDNKVTSEYVTEFIYHDETSQEGDNNER